jgi:phosphoadenosine phosphosulfate reductase
MGTTLGNFDEDFLTFYGVRRKESFNRSKYPKILESTKIDKQLSVSPVIDWLDLDIWLYIILEKLEFNIAYTQGFSRVGCWVCPHRGYWSDFITEIYNENIFKGWKHSLYNFAKKINKKDYKEYIDEEKWKLRRGGDGLSKVKKSEIKNKECVNEKNSYNFKLQRKLNGDFLELMKPFGKINYREKNRRSEADILSPKNEVLFTIAYERESTELRVTLVDLKDRYLYGKIMRQLNKYNSCMYCQACNSTCSFGALSVSKGLYKIDENLCTNCLKCVMHFELGCLIVSVLKIKKQEV